MKVNAIHRLSTVILSIGPDNTISKVVPYLENLSKPHEEDDEVQFAIAEELGKVFVLLPDKTMFIKHLEILAKHDETVVREMATTSLQ